MGNYSNKLILAQNSLPPLCARAVKNETRAVMPTLSMQNTLCKNKRR